MLFLWIHPQVLFHVFPEIFLIDQFNAVFGGLLNDAVFMKAEMLQDLSKIFAEIQIGKPPLYALSTSAEESMFLTVSSNRVILIGRKNSSSP